MIRILTVEDDENIAKSIKAILSTVNYYCDICYDGNAAVDVIIKGNYDLILLDVMLPGKDGFEIIEEIRGREVPVIFLTAKSDVNDKVRGLRSGADDYIAKPFSLKLLIARAEAVLKRNNRTWSTPPEPIHLPNVDGDANKGLVVREDIYSASIDGEDLRLTKMEFELLVFLIHHTGFNQLCIARNSCKRCL